MKSRGRNAHIFLSQDIQNEAGAEPRSSGKFPGLWREALTVFRRTQQKLCFLSVVEITEEW